MIHMRARTHNNSGWSPWSHTVSKAERRATSNRIRKILRRQRRRIRRNGAARRIWNAIQQVQPE